MKNTKRALFTSVMALILCFSMLVSTTFAWFTDEVKSGMNQIVAGNLDVELYHADKATNGASEQVKNDTKLFDDVKYWEPGAVVYENLTVQNAGTLALKWQMGLNFGHENDIDGHKLSDVLQIAILDDPIAEGTSRDTVLKAAAPKATSLAEFYMNGELAATESEDFAVVIFWLPGENDNIYNLNNGKTTSDGQKSLHIEFGVRLLATQMTGDSDSFGADYDVNAAADIFPGFQGGAGSIPLTLDEKGYTSTEVTFDLGDITVVIPVGVKLAAGYSSVYASAVVKGTTDTNIQLSGTEQMRPSDVHIEGVAADNTKAMLVTLKHYVTTGLNSGALTLYHVENGVDVPMTYAANPVNHNEFTYDPMTGDVTVALASFSEVAVVADTTNPWDGKTLDYQWYDASAKELTIYNADQLAGFAAIVDGKAEGIAQDSFSGKTVKLANNIYLSNQLFDPIGWGYENSSWNRTDADGNRIPGKVFQGTFDGDGKTIFDLHQSGWDLEDPNNDGVQDADYTYTNCGFGLFAAASNATFKNLTISGARIRVECVEAGVLVGLSQNNCTYNNIKILDSKIANYQRPAGGLIGEVSGDGTTTITKVIIAEDVVVGSLWGDFDAPVGGVIGAYWNDVDADPQIYMTNLDVGCRLDVYNDITSAYQWHAYRRAGMLIGNTDMTDHDNAHKAAAPFLHCEGVRVYYGDWVNYHYCEFTNQDNTWARNYPWVRVEAGENCSAYSNPRYGQPVVDGVTVSTDDHTCTGEHHMVRQFSQLYGGGQGVYGQDKHYDNGVTYPDNAYSITYVNDGKTLDVVYVTNNTEEYPVANDQAQKLVDEWATENMKDYNGFKFGGWMTAASKKLTKIPKDNTQNIVLYPYFTSPYTASFVDENANILAWCFFNEVNVDNLDATFATAKQNRPHPGDDYDLLYWVVRGTDKDGKTVNVQLTDNNIDWESFKGYKDVTITPHYEYKGANLIEVYDKLTGEIDHYEVAGYADGKGTYLVEIPAYVNGKPVIQINDGAFKSFDDIYAAVIPGTITNIGSNAFTEISNGKRDQVTLYYQGDPDDWKRAMDDLYVNKAYSYYTDYNTAGTYTGDAKLKMDSSWDSGAGDGSRIFFLDENGNVDLSKGYWELYDAGLKKNGSGWFDYGTIYVWVFHDHPYDDTLNEYKNCPNEDTHYGSFTDYDAADRPDRAYWEGVNV